MAATRGMRGKAPGSTILPIILLMGIIVLPAVAAPGSDAAGGPVRPEDRVLSPNLAALLDRLAENDLVPVIVTTASLAGVADEDDARAAGAAVGHRFGTLNGYSARVPAGMLRRLARGSNVAWISYDHPVRSFNDLNYSTVGADRAAIQFGIEGGNLDGRGVTVAVVDSGIADHPDLAGRQLLEVEIVGHEKGFADPYGHGTHVAGIIAGGGDSSSGPGAFRRFNGIAPRAGLISVRVLDSSGGGRVSDVLAGIDWVVGHKDHYHIRVMNLSLGHPVDQSYATDPLCQAVERAWQAGIVVVAAAGNAGAAGYATIHSPGNDPSIITVGASNNYRSATRSDDILTSYTSRGPTPFDHRVKPDLVAPGNRTISLRSEGSTLDTLHPELRVKQGAYRSDPASAGLDSPYFELSGSSMAAGVVSGMAALMIQSDPSLTPDTVKARLMKSAEKLAGYDVFSEGAGFADLYAALSLSDVAGAPTVSPAALWTATGIQLQDTAELWHGGDEWSLQALWGFDPLRGTGGLWGDTDLWADPASDPSTAMGPGAGASSVVWGGGKKLSGSSVVWGGGMQAASVVWGGGMKADSVVWGGGMQAASVVWGGGMTADSVVWGGGIQADSVVWGGGVQADSVVWGGGAVCTPDECVGGDNVPPSP
jgi:serine protease AprX